MLVKKLERVSPLKLYSVLRESDYPFILESATKHEKKARFSYVSANPEFVVEVKDFTKVDGEIFSYESNPFKSLKELHRSVGRTPFKFSCGFVGYFSYDCVHNYIGGSIEESSVFAFYTSTVIYDHASNSLYYFSLENDLKDAEKVVKKAKRTKIEEVDAEGCVSGCDMGKEEFEKAVEKAKEYIYDGEVFQVVLSREYEVSTNLDPFQVYVRLRKINPSPYMFCLEFEKSVVGASPETLVSVEGRLVKVNPIAGTVGKDEGSAEELLGDEKEKAEHVMLVDLARNDVRKVCEAGSVKVERFMEVVSYSHVVHIESEVVGVLRSNCNVLDAVEACFPAGTLTGAPKVRAMEIIDELEASRRRVYGGGVGYVSADGNSDIAIAIRMVEIDEKARVRAGAGIVADSIPEREFYETEKKMRATLISLGVRE